MCTKRKKLSFRAQKKAMHLAYIIRRLTNNNAVLNRMYRLNTNAKCECADTFQV